MRLSAVWVSAMLRPSGLMSMGFTGKFSQLTKGRSAAAALVSNMMASMPAYADHLRTLGGDLAAFLREARGVAESEDPVNALVGPGQQP